MPAKGIIQREKKIQATRSAFAAQGEEVVRALQGQLADSGLGGEIPDTWLLGVQDVLTRHLEARGNVLEEIDARKQRFLGTAKELRARRDDLKAELYDRMVRLRQTVRNVFGEARGHDLFGSGKTPRDLLTLIRVARALVERLRRPQETEEISEGSGVSFDWNVKLRDLEEPLSQLEALRRRIRRAEAEVSKAVDEKQQAMKELDRAQRGVFQVLEGLRRVAGLDGLATRLRPTVPQKRNQPAPTEADESTIEL